MTLICFVKVFGCQTFKGIYFPKNVEFKKLITKYNLRLNHDKVKFNTKLHVIIY